MNRHPPTIFGLIRHGRTLWNAEKRIQGQADSPLSEEGREMARNWGKQLGGLPWQRMLLSDLGRARETGQLVNETLQLPMFNDSRLREQDWGAWSGLTFPYLYAEKSDELNAQVERGWDFRPPGGESRLEVEQRARQALLAAHARWPGEHILVVCHEGIIKTLLYRLHNRNYLPTEPKLIKGYQLHLLEADADGLHLRQVNALALDGNG